MAASSNHIINPNAAIFSTVDAAAYLGVSPGMLRLSRHTGELFKGIKSPPYLKCGFRAVRYLKIDLDEWLAELPRYKNTADFYSKELLRTE